MQNKWNIAYKYAECKHSGQKRKEGIPYITHPIAVSEILKQKGYDINYQITGLFHDLLEDTDATEAEIKEIAGSDVLEAVKLLTKKDGYNMSDYINSIKSNPIAKAVKAADRLHNLKSATVTDYRFKKRYILESIDWFVDFDEDIIYAVKELSDTIDRPLYSISEIKAEVPAPEKTDSFILHGDIFFTPALSEYVAVKSGYVICENGVSKGVFEQIPTEYQHLPVHDYTNKLIIPGLVDLHTHAPQYTLCGTSMDLELMEWLNTNIFPEEAKYSDIEYAERSYNFFADAIKNSATTHASIFATIHRNSTELLMNYMEKTGIVSYVGKVNMDRESPEILCEESALFSAYSTFGLINNVIDKYKRTKPILTPRFVPTCSPELLEQLESLQTETGLPVQSHLSENINEIEFVKQLEPDSDFYGDVYDRYSLFGKNHNNGKNVRTLMAHCVHSSEDELSLMKQNGVFVVHCPSSNTNLSSGIAPVRKYLDMGLNVGLGSDVAAGHTLSIFSTIQQTIQVSKLYNHYIDNTKSPLTFNEAFYLATKGGGSFFGKVGSFENGYNFNAVVFDSSKLFGADEMSVEKTAEKAVYSSLDLHGIISKYVDGQKII